MNIMWSYYLIGVIYLLLIVLRMINQVRVKAFKNQQGNTKQVFSIKKDFFTTVSIICVLVTLLINVAALVGGKELNGHSILITLLVVGFTVLNSFSSIIFTEDQVLLLGYTLSANDIDSLKVKKHGNHTLFDMTFAKEIDSYNYAKLMVFGTAQNEFTEVIEKIKKQA